MRRVLALAALLVAVAPAVARAGCCCDAYVLLPHVAYQAGSFQSCFLTSIGLMRQRGVAMLIEDHVAGLVQRGDLPPGRLHVRGGNACAVRAPPVSVSRNEGGWYIEGAPALDLRNMIRTIDYFASPSWRPFEHVTTVGAKERHAAALRRFERVLDSAVPEPDMASIRAKRFTVLKMGDVEAIYQDDAVHYEIAGRRLDIKPRGFLPVQVGHRWILQSGDSLVALDARGEVVASHPAPAVERRTTCISRGLFATAHAKWVNVSQECSTVVVTYSLEQDAFRSIDIKSITDERWDEDSERLGIYVTGCG